MIKQIENGFEIYINSLLLIKHTISNPAIFLGDKDLDISMDNGEFEIKDETKYQPLIDFSIEGNKILFTGLTICHKEENDLLYLEFNQADKPLAIKIEADESEKIFGAGEHFTALNLRGKFVKNWVEEHITRKQIYNKIIRRIFKLKPKKWKFEDYKTYFVTPNFISTRNYFLQAQTNCYATFDFTNQNQHTLSFLETPKEIVFGNKINLLELNGHLCKYLGLMPLLPDWIYDGMILAIQGGTEKCDRLVNEMLENGARINGIWSQDFCGELYTFFGKQVLWNWETNKELYPNLEAYIKKWDKLSVKFLAYINPYLNANEPMYKYALENNYLVKTEEGNPFLTKATSFDFGIVDLTNPLAYDWYKSVIKNNYIAKGIKGWMADFGEYLPFKCKLHDKSGEELHNVWPDLWIKLNREALEETNNLGNIVFFNRAGYKDNVRYSTLIWNGDQHVDFSDDFGLGSVIRAALSLSLSGIGISHSDVGGYTNVPAIKRSKELYLRWLEMNTFTPVLRSHEGNKPWKNVQFNHDQETIEMTTKFSNIHYMLKPYLKHVEREYQDYGYPMIRPTFMYSKYYSEETYLLGQDLYVCPIIKKNQRKKMITIFEDGWVNLFSGVEYIKGEYPIECSIGKPTVFYKKDSKFSSLFIEISKYIGG